MAIGASLVAFVAYGLISFQAPFLQREHGLDVRDAANNFGAPLSLDTTDALLATQKVNDELEAHVRTQPEQYLWAHKRFKKPSEQHTNPYA